MIYEDAEAVRRDMAFEAVASMLWLRAGSRGRRFSTRAADSQNADSYGVLLDVDAAAAFLGEVADAPELDIAYVVTDSEAQYQLIANELPEHIEAVRLYEAYLRSVAIGLDTEQKRRCSTHSRSTKRRAKGASVARMQLAAAR